MQLSLASLKVHLAHCALHSGTGRAVGLAFTASGNPNIVAPRLSLPMKPALATASRRARILAAAQAFDDSRRQGAARLISMLNRPNI